MHLVDVRCAKVKYGQTNVAATMAAVSAAAAAALEMLMAAAAAVMMITISRPAAG